MKDSRIEQFLQDNEWINRAGFSEIGAEGQSCRIQIELSLSGHRLIRDHGMPEFERSIHSHQASLGYNEIYWEICPFERDVRLKGVPKPSHEFPRVLSVFDERAKRRLLMEISPQIDWFRGHFPGNPVLPGVVQLHWAITVSLAYFRFRLVPIEIKRLKFKNIVVPPKVIELSVCRSGQNEVQFEYGSLGQQHSEGRLVFDEDGSC